MALAQEISGSAFLFGGVNIKEHDYVVLTSHLPSEGLLLGDVGTHQPCARDAWLLIGMPPVRAFRLLRFLFISFNISVRNKS